MVRLALMLAVAGGLATAQQKTQNQQTPPPPQSAPPLGPRTKSQPPAAEPGKDINPPEEDVSIRPTEYTFNPLQAEHDLKVGNDYLKRGKLRAAEGRYREATKWNEKYGEAWLRLGEVEEKLKDHKGAREAYAKYLEVAADAKNVGDVRKRMEKLK